VLSCCLAAAVLWGAEPERPSGRQVVIQARLGLQPPPPWDPPSPMEGCKGQAALQHMRGGGGAVMTN